MTKRQLIDEITMRNPTAKTDFLARFEEADLGAYLEHLIVSRRPRLSSGGNRYAKYFVSAERMSAQAVQSFVESPLAASLVQPAPASRVEEPAQVEDLPLEQPEPEKVIQPALFTPPVADVNEVADEPLPVAESPRPEQSELPAEVSALETDSEVRVEQPAEIDMQETPVPVPAEATMQAEPLSAKEEIEELPQDQPAENAQALACWYRGEGEPIAVARDNYRQEQISDELEEISGLPSPYGQDFHGEDTTSNDQNLPPADTDEIEHEEIAVQEPVDEVVSSEEPMEDPAMEPAQEELGHENASLVEKKTLQPVAVGAEQEGSNGQDSDSWLFSD
jgi:hypothetical protein